MLSRGRMIWLLPHPLPSPHSRQEARPLTHWKTEKERQLADGSQIIRPQESMVLYKSFNTLWADLSLTPSPHTSLLSMDHGIRIVQRIMLFCLRWIKIHPSISSANTAIRATSLLLVFLCVAGRWFAYINVQAGGLEAWRHGPNN